MSLKKVIFRVDGSKDAGLGHILRSAAVAGALGNEASVKSDHVEIKFAVSDNQGARNAVKVAGIEGDVIWLNPDDDSITAFGEVVRENKPSVVIADINLTGIDEKFREVIHPYAALVSLHEHNYGLLVGDRVIAPTVRPLDIAPTGTPNLTHFTGPDYVILPPDIAEYRANAAEPAEPPVTTLITMGGGDPSRLTLKVLEAVRAYNYPKMDWKVVLGPASGYEVPELMGMFPMVIDYILGKDISRKGFLDLLSGADLVITNGGTTLYESLALGRPTISVPQNEFEDVVGGIMDEKGACVRADGESPAGILRVMDDYLKKPHLMRSTSEKGAELIDGKGASRIAHLIMEFLN